jgi:hypothetical protein
MNISITLTKGQLNKIAKQLAEADGEAVEVTVEVAPEPTPAPEPKAAPVSKQAWACTLKRKDDKAAYSAANVAGNRAINAYVGQARKALKAGDESALVQAIKQAHGVCRARVEAGATSFTTIADGLEARIAR